MTSIINQLVIDLSNPNYSAHAHYHTAYYLNEAGLLTLANLHKAKDFHQKCYVFNAVCLLAEAKLLTQAYFDAITDMPSKGPSLAALLKLLNQHQLLERFEKAFITHRISANHLFIALEAMAQANIFNADNITLLLAQTRYISRLAITLQGWQTENQLTQERFDQLLAHPEEAKPLSEPVPQGEKAKASQRESQLDEQPKQAKRIRQTSVSQEVDILPAPQHSSKPKPQSWLTILAQVGIGIGSGSMLALLITATVFAALSVMSLTSIPFYALMSAIDTSSLIVCFSGALYLYSKRIDRKKQSKQAKLLEISDSENDKVNANEMGASSHADVEHEVSYNQFLQTIMQPPPNSPKQPTVLCQDKKLTKKLNRHALPVLKRYQVTTLYDETEQAQLQQSLLRLYREGNQQYRGVIKEKYRIDSVTHFFHQLGNSKGYFTHAVPTEHCRGTTIAALTEQAILDFEATRAKGTI